MDKSITCQDQKLTYFEFSGDLLCVLLNFGLHNKIFPEGAVN